MKHKQSRPCFDPYALPIHMRAHHAKGRRQSQERRAKNKQTMGRTGGHSPWQKPMVATKLTLEVLGKRNALKEATRLPVRRSTSRLENMSGSMAHLWDIPDICRLENMFRSVAHSWTSHVVQIRFRQVFRLVNNSCCETKTTPVALPFFPRSPTPPELDTTSRARHHLPSWTPPPDPSSVFSPPS